MISDGIQLHYIINHIGELFTIIVLLELLVLNTSLPATWNKYCKNLKSLSHMLESIDLMEDKYQALGSAVNIITKKLMSDNIVQNTLQNLATLRKSLVDKNCSMVSSEFTNYLKQAITNLDKLVQDKPNVTTMYKCIKINALFVLSSHLFGNIDKKIFKSLIELNTKVSYLPVIMLLNTYLHFFFIKFLSLSGTQCPCNWNNSLVPRAIPTKICTCTKF